MVADLRTLGAMMAVTCSNLRDVRPSVVGTNRMATDVARVGLTPEVTASDPIKPLAAIRRPEVRELEPPRKPLGGGTTGPAAKWHRDVAEPHKARRLRLRSSPKCAIGRCESAGKVRRSRDNLPVPAKSCRRRSWR